MKRIMIAGCGGSAGINFIKSLRMTDEKFYIVGLDTNKYHLELPDVDEKYLVPVNSDPRYIDIINSLIKKKDIDFLHFQPDPEVFYFSENREKVQTKTFLPSKKVVRICQNKLETYKSLQSKHVHVPFSITIPNSKRFKHLFNMLKEKSDIVWIRAIKGAGSKASLPVKTYEHASSWINYWIEMKGMKITDFIMSEFLPGQEFAFQSLWKNGEIVTSQARERLEYIFGDLTPSGQTSSPSVARTVHNDEVNDIATQAIKVIDNNATGIFCVDLKTNKEGRVCVTEINAGRFFTTSNFFARLGSNMPYLYIKMGFNEELPILPKYNAIESNMYWIRLMDSHEKLIRGDQVFKTVVKT